MLYDFVSVKIHILNDFLLFIIQGTTQQRIQPQPEMLNFVLNQNLEKKIEEAKANYAKTVY